MATRLAAGSCYRSFLDAAVEIAGSDAASVQVYDDERSGLRLAGSRGIHPLSVQFWDLVVPEATCVCGMALQAGERVVVPDVEEAFAATEDLQEFRRSGLRAVQSTPLLVDGGRLVGMLSTHWRTPHEPSAAELRRIDSLAGDCAAAVARQPGSPAVERALGAHLLREVNQRIREMAGQFDSLAADDLAQEYLCECGCGRWVALSASEFDAILAAERPVTIQGHPVTPVQTASQLSRGLHAAALRAEVVGKRLERDHRTPGRPKPSE